MQISIIWYCVEVSWYVGWSVFLYNQEVNLLQNEMTSSLFDLGFDV